MVGSVDPIQDDAVAVTLTTAHEGESVHCDQLAFHCERHGIHLAIAPAAIAGLLVLLETALHALP
jgi:hypothetical protein